MTNERLTSASIFRMIRIEASREQALAETRRERMKLIMGNETVQGDYFVIKAKENGVHVIGLTRGHDTRFHHTEKLDKGEIMIAQFTEHTSAVKIRGKAIVMTRYGTVNTEE